VTPQLTIVIPAYNEARRLPRTLEDVLAYLSEMVREVEVIVVDDGSSDETSAIVRAYSATDPRVRLIRLPQNRGKGYAVRTGVVNAAGERILFADADGATPISELRRLDRELDTGAAIAIGSRAIAGAGVTVRARLTRRIIGRIFHQLVRRLTVGGIVDTQCGFKLFNAEAASALFPRMRMDGFSFDVELLFMAQRRGLRVSEVPVNWTHQPGSKVRVLRDGLRMARDLFHIRANALRGLYDDASVAHSARAPLPARLTFPETTVALAVARELVGAPSLAATSAPDVRRSASERSREQPPAA
jgi:dolichyl-phosphate beta-glucosyltransferase